MHDMSPFKSGLKKHFNMLKSAIINRPFIVYSLCYLSVYLFILQGYSGFCVLILDSF